MQNQYSTTLSPIKADKSPPPILPRLLSIHMTSPMIFIMDQYSITVFPLKAISPRLPSHNVYVLAESPALSDHINSSPINVIDDTVLATLPNTVARQPAVLCVQPGHDLSNCAYVRNHAHMPIAVAPIMHFIVAASLSEKWQFIFKLGLTTRGKTGSTPTSPLASLPTSCVPTSSPLNQILLTFTI